MDDSIHQIPLTPIHLAFHQTQTSFRYSTAKTLQLIPFTTKSSKRTGTVFKKTDTRNYNPKIQLMYLEGRYSTEPKEGQYAGLWMDITNRNHNE